MPDSRTTSPSAALQRLHRVLMPVGRLPVSERQRLPTTCARKDFGQNHPQGGTGVGRDSQHPQKSAIDRPENKRKKILPSKTAKIA
jgi:hypothetical protein